MIRGWLMAEVGKVCRDVDANKTLQTDEEIQFCCRSIFEDHPTIKVEEIRIAFNMIRKGKFGKLYERFKTAEILDALRRYEGEIRSPILEDLAHNRGVEQNKAWGADMTPKVLEALKSVTERLETTEPEPTEGEGIGSRLKKRTFK